MAAFPAEHPSRIRVRRALAGHVPEFGMSACSTILLLHFGVSTGARDLVRREQQSGAVPKSTVFERELTTMNRSTTAVVINRRRLVECSLVGLGVDPLSRNKARIS